MIIAKINNCRGDRNNVWAGENKITDQRKQTSNQWYTVFLFSKLNKIIFGYYDPETLFLNENKLISG